MKKIALSLLPALMFLSVAACCKGEEAAPEVEKPEAPVKPPKERPKPAELIIGQGVKNLPAGSRHIDIMIGDPIDPVIQALKLDASESDRIIEDTPIGVEPQATVGDWRKGDHTFTYGKDRKIVRFDVSLRALPYGLAVGGKTFSRSTSLEDISSSLEGCRTQLNEGGTIVTCADGVEVHLSSVTSSGNGPVFPVIASASKGQEPDPPKKEEKKAEPPKEEVKEEKKEEGTPSLPPLGSEATPPPLPGGSAPAP